MSRSMSRSVWSGDVGGTREGRACWRSVVDRGLSGA